MEVVLVVGAGVVVEVEAVDVLSGVVVDVVELGPGVVVVVAAVVVVVVLFVVVVVVVVDVPGVVLGVVVVVLVVAPPLPLPCQTTPEFKRLMVSTCNCPCQIKGFRLQALRGLGHAGSIGVLRRHKTKELQLQWKVVN